MEQEAVQAQAYLKKYFGGKNNIKLIRDKTSFHFDEKIAKNAHSILEDGYETYIAEEINTFHASSSYVTFRFILDLIDSDPQEIADKSLRNPIYLKRLNNNLECLQNELAQLSNRLMNFFAVQLWHV